MFEEEILLLDDNNKCSQGCRCRTCNNNLAGNNPASKYQRLKIIQNTVRVPSSMYTMNLAALNVYQQPSKTFSIVDISGTNYIVSPGVNWNQMSDRKKPHTQVAVIASGSTYHSSSTKHSITRCRPGASSPGGNGVDIKHNSYDRYLNRIKGKAPLRRGVIPPDFGTPFIPFNRAYPVYGGKTIKTSIINNCGCLNPDDALLYKGINTQNSIYDVTYTFNVGDYVFTRKNNFKELYKAQIMSVTNGIYNVQFLDGSIEYKYKDDLFIYFGCNDCENSNDSKLIHYVVPGDSLNPGCVLLTDLANGNIL